jgi:rhodanese-related sulfurtransferase
VTWTDVYSVNPMSTIEIREIQDAPAGARVMGVSAIDDLVDQARRTYARVTAVEAAALAADGALLVDTRPAAQRAEQGEVPGAVVVERTVLDSSTLAVATLRSLGLTRATDVIDGFVGWQAAGLPVVRS